jgi:outer membrane immunogenic protein
MNFKLIGAGFAAAAFLAAPFSAQAADFGNRYKAPAYVAPAGMDWSGFFVGANAGYEFGTSNFTTVVSDPGGFFDPARVAALAANGAGSMSPKGFTGGIQLGYNWQWNPWVFGIEGDADVFILKADRSVTYADPSAFLPNSSTIQQSMKTDWLTTARPRVGYAWDHFLFYGTGGLAVTQLKATTSYSESASGHAGSSSVSKLKLGWTAGLGVEYALWRRRSVKAEYLYASFGSVSYDTPLVVGRLAIRST